MVEPVRRANLPLFGALSSPAITHEAASERIPPGRLVEISGEGASARTTLAAAAVRQAQREGETVAWIQPREGNLYPPDLDDGGIDLEALVVVRVPTKVGAYGLCRAAELLLRSGGFGLVVLDMCEGTPPVHDSAWQGRLLGLARQHHSGLIVLTHKPAHVASLGPLVSLRIESERTRIDTGLFALHHRVLKNKSGIAWSCPDERRRGPWGLR
jgi:recombination protein RecA